MGKSNSFGGTEPQRRRHVVISEAGKMGPAVVEVWQISAARLLWIRLAPAASQQSWLRIFLFEAHGCGEAGLRRHKLVIRRRHQPEARVLRD
jgi:hypothetical protein